MEWIRSTLAAAKNGNRVALAKLAIPVIGFLFFIGLQLTANPSRPAVSITPNNSAGAPVVAQSSMWVHVVGAVHAPGVYPMPVGARLFDLIAAADGFTSKADQSSVNLARALVDGEQVAVRTRGQSDFGALSSSNLISINRASAASLETLPGVGPKLAARIIDWRDANGGFSAIEQLRKVGGIGDKLFAGLKDMVQL